MDYYYYFVMDGHLFMGTGQQMSCYSVHIVFLVLYNWHFVIHGCVGWILYRDVWNDLLLLEYHIQCWEEYYGLSFIVVWYLDDD